LNNSFPADANLESLIRDVGRHSDLVHKELIVRQNLNTLPDVPVELISKGVSQVRLKETLEGVRLELDGLPEVPASLVQRIGMLTKTIQDRGITVTALKAVDTEYESVRDELKAFPCDRLVNGLCPYNDILGGKL